MTNKKPTNAILTDRAFSKRIIAWYKRSGRYDLPWQQAISAYRVWVSEIMLQQTQVKTVIPYFNRFMTVFPTIQALSKASLDVLIETLPWFETRNYIKNVLYFTAMYQQRLGIKSPALALPSILNNRVNAYEKNTSNLSKGLSSGNSPY